MAVDIGQIVSSALGGAEASFARKEQRMNLAEARRRNTRKELNNRAITSGLYTLDDQGNFHVDIKKAYESPESKALLLDIINTSGSGAANYKDLNNQVKNGTFADLPKVVDAGDGTPNFIAEIKKEDGSIEPLTENRTSNPNDNPALIDAASLELLAEGAMLNSMGEFGVDGTAVAILQNLNFNSPTVRAQEATVNALRDEEDPAALTNLIAQLGPTIKQTDPNRGNVKVDELETRVIDRSESLFGSAPSTVTGDKDDDTATVTGPARTTIDEERTKQLATKYKISEDTVAALMNVKPRGPRANVGRNAPFKEDPIDVLSDQMLIDSGYMEEGKDAPLFKLRAKRKFVKDFYKDAEQEVPTQQEVDEGFFVKDPKGAKGPADDFDLGFDISEIPTDIEGATTWFSDKANTDKIDQLDPDKVAKVREFLEDKNINSKKELVDAVKQGTVTDNQARSIARITAWSVVDKNGQKDAQLSANIYSGFINEMQTGNPDIDPVKLANVETARNKLALEVKKFGNTLSTQQRDEYKSLLELYETAGDKGFDSAEFLQQLKPRTTLFLRDRNFNELDQTEKALMDGVLSQALLESARKYGSTGIGDWFMDIFRGEAGDTLGNTMDNVAIKYDKPGPDGKPIELVFLRTRGGGQIEAEESITWNNVTEIIGEGQLANYLLSRAKRR